MASASGVRAGKAYVEVGADNSSLLKSMAEARARVEAFGSAVAGVGKTLAIGGATITAPFLTAAKMFADAGSALNDASARTGVSVEALSALGFAAQQTGTDLETVEGSIRKMQKALVAGSEENQQAAATFASLGLSVESLAKLKPDQQFERVARAVAKIQDPTAKAAAAMQVFGKSGTAILPLIDDLDALTGQAKALGLVMSTEDAAAADALGDAMDAVGAQLKAAANVVGATLAPVLTQVAETISRVIKSTMDWVNANRELIATAFKVGVSIAAAGAALFMIGGAIAALVNPIALAIAGLASLAAWLVKSTTVGGQALAWLGQRFADLTANAVQSLKGIADALRAGDIGLAGQILWAGLKVEWLKGTTYLQSVWADWGTATVEVFKGISYQIAGLMTDAWAAIQNGFVSAVGFMQDVWTSFGGFFAKVWAQIKALFTGDDIAKEIERINAEIAATKDERAKGRADQLGQIESNRQGARSALNDQQQAEVDARRKTSQDSLAGNAAALKAAQDELNALTSKAGKEAELTKKLDASKPPGTLAFTPDNLDQAVQAQKATVAGSFSGAALGRLGAGTSVQDEQLKEAKKSNEQLAALNKKAAVGRLVFS